MTAYPYRYIYDDLSIHLLGDKHEDSGSNSIFVWKSRIKGFKFCYISNKGRGQRHGQVNGGRGTRNDWRAEEQAATPLKWRREIRKWGVKLIRTEDVKGYVWLDFLLQIFFFCWCQKMYSEWKLNYRKCLSFPSCPPRLCKPKRPSNVADQMPDKHSVYLWYILYIYDIYTHTPR